MDRLSQFNCELTYIYGYNTITEEKPLWEQLRRLKGTINGPWIILGDFNTLLHSDDRVNAVLVHPTETIDFQNCITDLGVGQVTRKGWQFSWCNKQDVPDRIYNHIDWCLVMLSGYRQQQY